MLHSSGECMRYSNGTRLGLPKDILVPCRLGRGLSKPKTGINSLLYFISLRGLPGKQKLAECEKARPIWEAVGV